MKIRYASAIFVAVIALLLVSCGGGGGGSGGSSGTTGTPSSNWDTMVWDQGNWN